MDDAKRVTRKSSPPIKVYCLPEERELIEANAKRAGVSVARYLRDVGQGYLFDRPIPGSELMEKLRRYPRGPIA